MIPILFVIAGFVLLVVGGELLVRASIGLSLKLKLSRLIIGLTVVSFATSAPELIVSIQAALNNLSGLAVGNVVGSNIANIGLILGITSIIAPLTIEADFFKFNWPWMLGFSVLLAAILIVTKGISHIAGAGLLSIMVLFLYLLIRRARKNPEAVNVDDDLTTTSWYAITGYLAAGGVALWLGSEWLVKGAVQIATQLAIPESVIAVSMVAIGTSVPELAASVIAAIKKEKAISLGNLIGSNIFNVGSVLGITAIISPITIDATNRILIDRDIYWMLGFAAIIFPLAFIPQRYILSRYKGILLVIAYVSFIILAFSTP